MNVGKIMTVQAGIMRCSKNYCTHIKRGAPQVSPFSLFANDLLSRYKRGVKAALIF
jgi:hypothetical protein